MDSLRLPAELDSLLWITLVAALAPLLTARLPGKGVPEVAVLLVAGLLIGPSGLGLAATDESITLLASIGLGFLFLTGGYELDPTVLRGRRGRLAGLAWVVSVLAALAVVGLLVVEGTVSAYVPVVIALTTTALGTLQPMLRDSGALASPFGRTVLANGAVGEFGPILAISVLLSTQGASISLLLLVAFGAIAVVLGLLPHRFASARLAQDFARGNDTTAQTAVRWTALLLVALLVLADDFGLDTVLGAFAAGLILRQVLPPGGHIVQAKIDGLAFGFFVPLFFVVSGMSIDLGSIVENPGRMLLFFVLMGLVRGVPVLLLFRRELPGTQPWQLALLTATGLPVIVAITQVAMQAGVMQPANAAALVGAGVLTVLVFPSTATLLASSARGKGEGGTE